MPQRDRRVVCFVAIAQVWLSYGALVSRRFICVRGCAGCLCRGLRWVWGVLVSVGLFVVSVGLVVSSGGGSWFRRCWLVFRLRWLVVRFGPCVVPFVVLFAVLV